MRRAVVVGLLLVSLLATPGALAHGNKADPAFSVDRATLRVTA